MPSKYKNKRVEIDGIKFDSQAEAKRYRMLKIRLDCGDIGDITIHPCFLLQDKFKDFEGKTQRKIVYEADFKYWDNKLQKTVIEDVKGFVTQSYKIKKKLFLKLLPENTVFIEIK